MRGMETLDYLRHGGILKLGDAPPGGYIYRLTENGLEAKSTDPEAFGLDKIFTYMPASLDWLISEEFIAPEEYNLTMEEATLAMGFGAHVEPEGWPGFDYSWGDYGNIVLTWEGEPMEDHVEFFSEEEIKAMWRVVSV